MSRKKPQLSDLKRTQHLARSIQVVRAMRSQVASSNLNTARAREGAVEEFQEADDARRVLCSIIGIPAGSGWARIAKSVEVLQGHSQRLPGTLSLITTAAQVLNQHDGLDEDRPPVKGETGRKYLIRGLRLALGLTEVARG